jgi:hypothetical protein
MEGRDKPEKPCARASGKNRKKKSFFPLTRPGLSDKFLVNTSK